MLKTRRVAKQRHLETPSSLQREPEKEMNVPGAAEKGAEKSFRDVFCEVETRGNHKDKERAALVMQGGGRTRPRHESAGLSRTTGFRVIGELTRNEESLGGK